MSEKKYYVVGTTTPESWERVHAILTQDGTLDDNLPSRAVECTDLKEHSPTRSVYLLDDAEAEQLSKCSDIKFIHLDHSKYLDLFPPKPDEIHAGARYSSPVKNYRDLSVGYPNPPTTADINRAGYQVLRGTSYANSWTTAASIVNSVVPNITGTGIDIDVIVGDEGCWFGHVEFANNTGNGPADYKWASAGNVLSASGTCDVLDLVLDGPYYLDPAWFNANPGTRLTTRWDGTIVPTETAAKNWWGDSSQRSGSFASFGTVAIPGYYTRANCNGSDTAMSAEGQHGTACAGQTYGRTFGWAYNANKWFIDAYGSYGLWPVDNYFDVMKIFHQAKPINPTHGNKNPTISSNSWGFRTTVSNTGYYYFRQGTTGAGGVAYTGTKPNFMYYLGSTGDSGRFKGEMLDNSLTVAGDEMIAAGVIFVAAAGNSNQQQVSPSHPNFDNYWATAASTPLSSATHSEFGYTCYNTTNRRGFPQHLGKYTSGSNIVYPVINIGALDDSYTAGGLERKVNYSDMGNEIDVFTPGDGTLSSAWLAYGIQYPRYDQRSGGLTSYDTRFSGTSSACPTATGMIATALQYNRTWTWQDVRTWLQSLTEQSSATFYQGPDPSTATDTQWSDLNSLQGGVRRVLYNNISASTALSTTLAVSTKSVPANQAITPFTPVTATGGTLPYTFGISPALPTGLSFNTSNGQITGTPTVSHSASSFTVTVTDSALASSSKSFSLEVQAIPAVATTLALATVSIHVLNNTNVYTPVIGSGGVGTLTYSISPSLPTGLSFSTTYGTISGVPTILHSASSFTITVTDTLLQTSSKTFSLNVYGTPLIANVALALISTYPFTSINTTPITALGGEGTKTFSISPALPAGLSFNTANGRVTGSVSSLHSVSSHNVTVVDQVGQTDSAYFGFRSVSRPIVVTESNTKIVLAKGSPISPFKPVTLTGGNGTIIYSVDKQLPDGVFFSTTTGILYGTPLSTGRSNTYVITATDELGLFTSVTLQIKIISSLPIVTSDDQNKIYNTLFSIMGTTSTGYGAILISDPVQYGDLVKADDWNRLKLDIERCLVHQTGTSTNSLTVSYPDTLITAGPANRMYTQIQLLQTNINQVHPSQLESTRVNTANSNTEYWTNTNYSTTSSMIAGTGYITSVNWAWFYQNQLHYFFNLGGNIQPRINIDRSLSSLRDVYAWQGLVTTANQLVFGKEQFNSAIAHGNVFEYVVTGHGVPLSLRRELMKANVIHVPTERYSANGIIVKFQIIGNQIIGSLNFVAGIGKKGKKKGKKVFKGKKIFTKKGRYILVKLILDTDFLTTYPVGNNGGIGAQIPQTQIIANKVSVSPAPVPQFTMGRGQSSQIETVTIRNNSTLTCVVDNIVLRGYTTGTITPTSLVIPPTRSDTFEVQYSSDDNPGHYRGYIDILCNVNPLTLFTEINVGSVTPMSWVVSTTTSALMSQDFVVDHRGGDYKRYEVEFPEVSGFTYDTNVPDHPDTFRVLFDPHGHATGTFVTNATVTVYPLDSSQDTTVINVPISVTTDIIYRNIGRWISAAGYSNSKLGVSYDIIGGATYLTLGVGINNPPVAQLGNETSYPSWSEVYRIPLSDKAETLYSNDYAIKTVTQYGMNFGVGTAENSLVTVVNDGYGNIDVRLNTLRENSSTTSTSKILLGLANSFYYYDPTVFRNTQLQQTSDLIEGGQTYYFLGFNKGGDVRTSLVKPNT